MGLFEDLTNRNNGDEVDASWWNSIIVALRNAFPDYTALSGDVVGTTDTQDLSNKTFTDAITLEELSSTPSTPASGDKKLYAKDNGKVYTLDDEGNEAEVGSGAGGGTKTYIDNDSAKFETSIGSWETDDGAGSAATTITLTRNTTTPLSGEGDLSFAKSAADGDGEYAKLTTLAIDRSDRGNILFFSCNVDASDSNYANNLEFEFYDNTNSAVLYAGSSDDLAVSKSQGKFTAPVYLESTTASIEVRIKINDTDATAYTVYFDDFKLGPAAQVQTVYRKSQTIDLTGSGDFTGGEIQVERVGNQVTITLTQDGTRSVASATISSATGLLPDWATPSATQYNVTQMSSSSFQAFYVYSNGSILFVTRNSSLAGVSGTSFSSGSTISYTVPDTTGPTLTENELSLQTVSAKGQGNGGTSITANTTNIDFTETEDSHSAFDGTTFTAPKTGYYVARGYVRFTTSIGNAGIRAYINGTQDILAGFQGISTLLFPINWRGKLTKGDALTFRSDTGGTLSNDTVTHWIDIHSVPDYTVLGAVKERNRYVTKFLTGDQTSDGVMSDLTVNGLVIGKHYELKHHFYVRADAADTTVAIDVENGGVRVGYIRVGNGGNSSTGSFANHTPGGSFVFKATATSLTFEAESLAAGTTIFGNSSTLETFIQVVERNDLIETTDF